MGEKKVKEFKILTFQDLYLSPGHLFKTQKS